MPALSPELVAAIKLQRAGRIEEAERAYRQLLNHVSQAAQAHSALGLLLSNQGRVAEAHRHYQHAAQQTPGDFLAHKLLADSCSEQGEIDASIEHYRNAAQCRPNDWLWQLRADIVMPVVFASNAAVDATRSQFVERLQTYRDASHNLDLDELTASGCKPPLSLAYHGRDDRPIKELFASIFAEHLPADLPRRNSGKPHVGFVVTQGNEGVFLRGMAGIVRNLDAGQLRVTIVCAPTAQARLREAIRRDVEYLPTGERFTETVEAVRQARFDLLYFWEIGTDCVNYFLPFFRLAPVQCTSWGWPVTSGIADVDYFLSSESLEPVRAEAHYTEKLVRLRNIPNYYERIPFEPASARARLGLDARDRIYFCGQNPRKLHPDFDLLLGRILRCDVRGRVVLVESAKPAITAALKRRLEKRLPDCVERVRWVGRMTQDAYLTWMAAADCVLDTPNYCGGANSTYDAFSVGAPIVTLTGEYHRGRYTTAAYRQMDLTDCIAQSANQYVDIALRLASDPDFARDVRRQIAERRDVLFGNVQAAREVENFFMEAISQVR
jgi:protein O-GlcNAc transferase